MKISSQEATTTEVSFLVRLCVYKKQLPKTLRDAFCSLVSDTMGNKEKETGKQILPSLCRRRCTVEQRERESTKREDGGQGAETSAIRRHWSQTEGKKQTNKSSEVNKHTSGAQGRVVALCSHTWPERRWPSVWKHFCSHCAFEGRRGVIGTRRKKTQTQQRRFLECENCANCQSLIESSVAAF